MVEIEEINGVIARAIRPRSPCNNKRPCAEIFSITLVTRFHFGLDARWYLVLILPVLGKSKSIDRQERELLMSNEPLGYSPPGRYQALPSGTAVSNGARFSDNMLSQLRELAKMEHTSVSAIVRAATQAYLDARLNQTL
jgi:Ribbon-helix-helix protein, copG family